MIDWWKRYLQFNVTAKLTMLASVAMSWRCAEWFMNLEEPTTQQSAFVSLVTAMLSASFALWLGKEAKTDRGGHYAPDTNRSDS